MAKSAWPAATAFLLVAAVVLIFFPVVGYEFVHIDDMDYVARNPGVQAGLSLASIKAAFTSHFTSRSVGMWLPGTWISFLVDHALYGQNPGGYHLTNLILHAVNALLLFAILRMITGSLFSSALTAFLFAVHPLHVESVAWITERKDVLSTFFGLLSILFYVRYATGRGVASSYLAAAFFFTLSLLSKPMLVTLPFVFLLLDWWPLERLYGKTSPPEYSRTRLILEKVPFLMLSAMASAVTLFLMPKETLASLPIFLRLENAFVAYAGYLVKMVWPSGLSVLYPLPPAGPDTVKVIGAFVLVAVISAGVIMQRTSRPYLAVGWLWYLGTLVPVIGVVQNGFQAMADRFTYVPLVGLFIMFAWGLPDLLRTWRHRKTALAIVSVSVVLACMAVSAWQVRFWKNTVTLFERALAVTSNNWFAHCILATALYEKDNIEEALTHLKESLRICPDCFEPLCGMAEVLTKEERPYEAIEYYQAALRTGGDLARLHINLGTQLEKVGRTDEALAHFARAASLEPDSIIAPWNLGRLLLKAGKYQEALRQFEKVLEKNPRAVEVLDSKGTALVAMGNAGEAQKAFERALEINPDFASAHYSLASLFARTGRLDQAVPHFEAALRLEPGHVKARLNFGNTLLFMGKKDEAMAQYRQALAVKPDFAEAYKNLGLLLAAGGNTEEAVFHLEEALRINPGDQATRAALTKLKK
ncbi:MAG: tetratricopeptide repeat protein [Thermodesulfobacteriota bacterium]